MKKSAPRLLLSLLLLAPLLAPESATAEVCTLDAVPAATLLLPYFEVSPSAGVDTLFSLNNASAAPALAHITFWTDLSIPTLDFDVYLSGYDIVTVRLSDVLRTGVVPSTSFDSMPPGDFSLPNTQFPGCDAQLPLPNLPADFITHIQNAHSGQGSAFFGGQCSGIDHGDAFFRGYITIDSVSACSLSFPDTPGYFVSGGGGIANNNNVLWGDYFYTDKANRFAQGHSLVHVEASGTDPRVTTPGEYTFYGRYVAANADDNREPLGTTWAVRYLNGGAFSGGTDLVYWRDSKLVQNPFSCGILPLPFPLSQTQLIVFDEDENPGVIESPPFSPQPPGVSITPFGFEAGRSDTAVYAAEEFGWIFLDMNTSTGGVFDPFSQAHIYQFHSASGEFSVGLPGIQLDSACDPNTVLLPVN